MQLKTVAVLIPALNEEEYIEKCVYSVLNNGYDLELLSVFVCDGGSTDNTKNIVEQILKKYKQVILLNNAKKTAPFAFNLGIKNTNADVVIILGAHAALHKNYIQKSIEILNSDTQIACVGGILNSITLNESSEVIAKAMSSVFGVGSAHFRTGKQSGFVDTVAFGAYKKSVFEKAGLFDEDLTRNQDDEFNYRLTKAGYKIFLSKDIRADYFVRTSYKKLFKQYFQYGYWKVLVNKKHKSITSFRQLVPFMFVLSLFFGALFSIIFPNFYLLFLSGCFLYLSAAFFFASKLVSGFKKVGKVALSFFILHFSYGYGYLEGIIRFQILRLKPSSSKTKLSR